MRGIGQGYINKWGAISEIVITPKSTVVNLIRFSKSSKEQVFKWAIGERVFKTHQAAV